MTKPIIVVKIPGCKLLYIIPVKGFSWPYLIIIAMYNAAVWPHTFSQTGCYCLAVRSGEVYFTHEQSRYV